MTNKQQLNIEQTRMSGEEQVDGDINDRSFLPQINLKGGMG